MRPLVIRKLVRLLKMRGRERGYLLGTSFPWPKTTSGKPLAKLAVVIDLRKAQVFVGKVAELGPAPSSALSVPSLKLSSSVSSRASSMDRPPLQPDACVVAQARAPGHIEV